MHGPSTASREGRRKLTHYPEPALDPGELAELQRGVEQFNQGYFFECHDTLEELWAGLRGPSRDFFQGLIQTAVAFYHLTGGNLAGAASMLERALKRFRKYPDVYFGFELARHRGELEGWLARIRAGEAGEPALPELPKWAFRAGATRA